MVDLDKDSLMESLNEMESELRLYPIEDGLEDDVISFIKNRDLSESEILDLNIRLEDFFYGAQIKCRREPDFFQNGFEFYMTNIELDLRKLNHVRDSFPSFSRVEVICDEDSGFPILGIRLIL